MSATFFHGRVDHRKCIIDYVIVNCLQVRDILYYYLCRVQQSWDKRPNGNFTWWNTSDTLLLWAASSAAEIPGGVVLVRKFTATAAYISGTGQHESGNHLSIPLCSVSVVGLNAGDVAFLQMGIHLFPFFYFIDLMQEKSQAFKGRCWRLSGMWCQMPESQGNCCGRGTSNVCTVSKIPITFNITLHYKWRFLKVTSSTPANIFSSVKTKPNQNKTTKPPKQKQKQQKKEGNKGTRTTIGSYPHICFCIIKRSMIQQLEDYDFS